MYGSCRIYTNAHPVEYLHMLFLPMPSSSSHQHKDKRPRLWHCLAIVSALLGSAGLLNRRLERIPWRAYLTIPGLVLAASLWAPLASADDINCNPVTRKITFNGNGVVVVEKTAAGVETNHSATFVSNAANQYKLNYCKKCQVPFTDTVTGSGSSLISHMKSTYLPEAVFCYAANPITSLPQPVPAGVATYTAAIKEGLTSLMGHTETVVTEDTKIYHGTNSAAATTIITKGPALVGNGISGAGFYTSNDKMLAVAFGHVSQTPADIIQFDLKKDLPVCKIPSALRNDNIMNIFPVDRYRSLLRALGTDCALMRNQLTFTGVTGTEILFWTDSQLKYLGNRKRQKE